MDDFKVKLAEAQELFHSAMVNEVLRYKKQVIDNIIDGLKNNDMLNDYKTQLYDDKYDKVKTRVAEAEKWLAELIVKIETKKYDDAAACKVLAKLYYRLSRKVTKISNSCSPLVNTDYESEALFYEKCLFYNDLYEKLSPDDSEIIKFATYGGESVLEGDVLILLNSKYKSLGHNNKIGVNRLDDLFARYADQYGKNSCEYVQKLLKALDGLEPSSIVSFIDKWSDANSAIKDYSSVWGIAADNVSLNSPKQSSDENLAQLRKKIVFLERAASLDPNKYVRVLNKCRTEYEERLSQNGNKNE